MKKNNSTIKNTYPTDRVKSWGQVLILEFYKFNSRDFHNVFLLRMTALSSFSLDGRRLEDREFLLFLYSLYLQDGLS